MTNRTAIYARTSPDCPLPAEDQVDHLRINAAERGWTIAKVFTDRPMSVKQGADRRPAEAALTNAIRNGAVDRVLIWSLDRVGRSLVELVEFFETCRRADVAVYLDQQNIDTAESNGISFFDLSAMMALHLRQMRRDRILRGQAAARSLSIRFGRPPIPRAKTEKAKMLLATGKGVRQVARLAGISAASVSRLKNASGSESLTNGGPTEGAYNVPHLA